MLTADVNLNEFSRSMARISNRLRIAPAEVLKKEVGELIKTLVKLSPPKNLARSKTKAERDVRSVYRPMPKQPFHGAQAGRREIQWLYAAPGALLGINRSNIKTAENAASAKRNLYPLREAGTPATTRLGTRGRGLKSQAVVRSNKTILSRNVIKTLSNKLKDNFGRLKAGWLVAVGEGKIKISGANMPPKWVTKHIFGARGEAQDQTFKESFPSFTIINRAVGVGNPEVRRIASAATAIRAKAMASNLARVISGQKTYL